MRKKEEEEEELRRKKEEEERLAEVKKQQDRARPVSSTPVPGNEKKANRTDFLKICGFRKTSLRVIKIGIFSLHF